jgi:hypothetical protein
VRRRSSTLVGIGNSFASRARNRLAPVGQDDHRQSSSRLSLSRSLTSLYSRRRDSPSSIRDPLAAPISSVQPSSIPPQPVLRAPDYLSQSSPSSLPLSTPSVPPVGTASNTESSPRPPFPHPRFPPEIDRLLPTDLRDAATSVNATAGTLLVLQGVVHATDTVPPGMIEREAVHNAPSPPVPSQNEATASDGRTSSRGGGANNTEQGQRPPRPERSPLSPDELQTALTISSIDVLSSLLR